MWRVLRLLVLGYWKDKPAGPSKPKSCRGYNQHGMPNSCNGFVSPLCWCGRCRACCASECECEDAGITREEAELIRAHREERKALLEAIK